MQKTSRAFRNLCALSGFLAGCGGISSPDGLPTPSEACAAVAVTQLNAGQHVILDPAAASGCLRIPAAGAQGAKYLLVLASANGTRSSAGIEGPYLLRSSLPLEPLSSTTPLAPAPSFTGALAAQFDATLRRREAELAADPRNRPGPYTAPALVAAPPLGDVRNFKTCSNLACTSFTTVAATARYIGQHVAVYMDNTVPQNDPLQDSDLAQLGAAFDNYHYPIDTTAFGRESDIDANGVVLMLMTDAVNSLTPDCTDGRIIGYFYGGDLLTGTNSNRAEVFYTLVPAPATAKCTVVTRSLAVNNLKPTLIHEFQHMISFNQHVLLRAGSSEEVWLNEAMSHFAEELGGRLVPNAECIAAGYPSCRSQYTSGDLLDSYDYLKDTETHYLVFPASSQGTLEERGAGWLFLRWVLDHYGADVLATATTRSLVATSLTGVANLTGVTGGNFSEMVPRWLMAAYLDDGPDLPSEPTGFLSFSSWGLRAIWTNPANQVTATPPGPFSGFPLQALALDGNFSHAGTLKAGSGRHFLITQAANESAVDLQVLRGSGGGQLDATLQARFGIVRIR